MDRMARRVRRNRLGLAVQAVIAILLGSFSAAISLAQETPGYLPAKDGYNVFVLGDSLAAGLGAGLVRMAEGDPKITVDGRYKEDSGLARPEFYDWNEALPKILESNAIDIAVIMIGANDTRDIRDGSLRYGFGTQEWTNAYVAQIDRLAKGLKQAGAAVYWVELPPMQAARYDAGIRALAILQRERARALGIRYVETARHLLGRDGRYSDMGLDPDGELRRLRDRDGVHFHKAGNNTLAGLVLSAIRADIQASGKPAPSADIPAGPVFGQVPASGAANTLHADLAPTAAAAPAVLAPPAKDPKAVAARTAPGSAAERLFKRGDAPRAPPGRFDDFAFSAR